MLLAKLSFINTFRFKRGQLLSRAIAVDFKGAQAKAESTKRKVRRYARFVLFTLVYFILTSLILILVGKSWFAITALDPYLNMYGVIVSVVLLLNFFITFIFYKDPYVKAKKLTSTVYPSKPYKVSFMVAVFNEEEIIERCLDSLVTQTYLNKEIIVVNDYSTDNTAKILDAYHKKHPEVRIIHLSKNVKKKKALGQAMLHATGEIFAFTDSDSVVAPDALARVVDVFASDPDAGAVSGHSRALNANKNLLTKMQDAWYEGQFSIRKAYESIFSAVTCVSGPLAVFRKSAIYNYIPAWEADTFLGQEFKFATDRTLTSFVLGSKSVGAKLKRRYADSPFVKEVDYPAKNWKVVYTKSARVLTQVPDTLKRVLKQQVRWKKSFIRNTFFTGAFYWKKPLPVALVYYLHIIFVFAGPFITFRHLVYLPLRGDLFSAIAYLIGIAYVGFVFGMAYKVEDKKSDLWVFRPLMSLLSTLLLSWLVFYSMVTIKKMIWSRV